MATRACSQIRHRHPSSNSFLQKQQRLLKLEEQLARLCTKATDKEENKQVALGTAKLNYLDPRISIAWCVGLRPLCLCVTRGL